MIVFTVLSTARGSRSAGTVSSVSCQANEAAFKSWFRHAGACGCNKLPQLSVCPLVKLHQGMPFTVLLKGLYIRPCIQGAECRIWHEARIQQQPLQVSMFWPPLHTYREVPQTSPPQALGNYGHKYSLRTLQSNPPMSQNPIQIYRNYFGTSDVQVRTSL